jgi:hypothetical protein
MQRKQLTGLGNLRLAEEDTFTGRVLIYHWPARPSYTPIFDGDTLVGVFFSTDTSLVCTRLRVAESDWPADYVYLNHSKIKAKGRGRDLRKDLELMNMKSKGMLDPSRNPRPLWDRPQWDGYAIYSNVDTWARGTLDRLKKLKEGTATTVLDGECNMAMLGIMLGAIACLDPRVGFDQFDDIIGQEADAYLRNVFNYAYGFRIGEAKTITGYPFGDFLTEKVVVRVNVPENMHFIGKPPPLYLGRTYIGLDAFKSVARKMFIFKWKMFAGQLRQSLNLQSLNSNSATDPALIEFMQKVRLRPMRSNLKISTSPLIFFPILSLAAPPCLQTLFADRPMKHYARWQLAELAVDMGWTLPDLMSHFHESGRTEVAAAYQGYQKKPRTTNRCKIYMRSGKLCPFDKHTFDACCGAQIDIEDMNPALSFQHRLLRMNAM